MDPSFALLVYRRETRDLDASLARLPELQATPFASRYGFRSNALPEETVAFWHELCHRFGGRNRHKAAHRELARMWAKRAPIKSLPSA